MTSYLSLQFFLFQSLFTFSLTVDIGVFANRNFSGLSGKSAGEPEVAKCVGV